MVRLLLGALVLVACAAGDRCDVTTLVLHCESRCAGVNATSVSSSNPPNKFLLTPVEKPMFAQLEDGTGRRLRPAREVEAVDSATAFTELPPAPANRLSNDGSPALPSTSVASTTDYTTNSAYAPTHEAMMPDQIVSAIGPVSQCARSPGTPRRAPPRCLRGGIRRWSALGLHRDAIRSAAIITIIIITACGTWQDRMAAREDVATRLLRRPSADRRSVHPRRRLWRVPTRPTGATRDQALPVTAEMRAGPGGRSPAFARALSLSLGIKTLSYHCRCMST